MLWKILLSVSALLGQQPRSPVDQSSDPSIAAFGNFSPSEYGSEWMISEDVEEDFDGLPPGKLYGGDMIFPDGWDTSDGGIRDVRYRWPRGVIPVQITRSAAPISELIVNAMKYYNRNTCIRFVPYANQRDYIRIIRGRGCYSAVGRNGSRQDMSLGNGCDSFGTVLHELGHAVGLFHEHQRSDRNNYIWVYEYNAKPEFRDQFKPIDPNVELIFTPYDYDSIMHYGSDAFSNAPGLKTMEAKNGHPLVGAHLKYDLTYSDIYNIRRLYRCP